MQFGITLEENNKKLSQVYVILTQSSRNT